jgi:hypothetical protein
VPEPWVGLATFTQLRDSIGENVCACAAHRSARDRIQCPAGIRTLTGEKTDISNFNDLMRCQLPYLYEAKERRQIKSINL